MFVHGPVAVAALCHWYVNPVPIVAPFNESAKFAEGHAEAGVATEDPPATGFVHAEAGLIYVAVVVTQVDAVTHAASTFQCA